MTIRPLDDTIGVCGQITVEDLPGIAAQGYCSLICNRPDDEEPGQPSFAEIAAAAAALGMQARHIPVAGGVFPPDAVAEFGAAMAELPGPVLAYCRSGARSTTMWQMTSA